MKTRDNLKAVFKLSVIILSSILILLLSSCIFDENVYIDFYEDCLYMMNSDGSGLLKLLDGFSSYAQFVPNRPLILYRGKNNNLYTIDYNGSNINKISDTLEVKQEFPALSLDGYKVVFISEDDLFYVNMDGSNLKRLTYTNNVFERQPSFAPDGNEVIYDSWNSIKDCYHICTIDLTNLGKDTLLTSNYFLNWPHFSSDGETIYFTKSGTNEGLYSMNNDGSDIIKLISEISAGFPIEVSVNKLLGDYIKIGPK
ncbi:MAG: PD40 domain-containing protein [Candidatus Cloacimonetes bacterium]|nr:PD40 domain-containing protein [Candidatus Cloacimonadota bacterium]